jgi:hypothetical protein
LIEVLLNENAEFGDRDDAAMNLAEYDDSFVESALFKIAGSDLADVDLADRCGESLAEIWCRKSRINKDIYYGLNSISRTIAEKTIKVFCPNLLNDIDL